MFPLFPFVLGALAGAAAVMLLKGKKAGSSLRDAAAKASSAGAQREGNAPADSSTQVACTEERAE